PTAPLTARRVAPARAGRRADGLREPRRPHPSARRGLLGARRQAGRRPGARARARVGRRPPLTFAAKRLTSRLRELALAPIGRAWTSMRLALTPIRLALARFLSHWHGFTVH